LQFLLLSVGTPKAPLAEAIAEYETRAGRYWPFASRAVKEEPARGLSADVVRRKEGERLLAAAAGHRLIACTEDGTTMTSPQFAAWMVKAQEMARDVAFVIGGAYGLDAAVTQPAERRLALAPWTMPHDLARLVLAEQCYRAGTLLRGEPYHK
jgi:23S rRNA (pseudouridine1915-N3)-methyltransferase